jgi:hypothetical protein
LVALAVWTGGLVVIVGAVIPAVFNSFGMEPGGRFLTKVFDGYNRLTVAAIVLLVGASSWRMWRSQSRGDGLPSASANRVETGLLTLMIALAAVIIIGVGPHSVSLQEQAFAAQGEAAKKAAYDAFFRSHMLVRALYVVNLLLGIGLLTVKVKRWTRGS